MRGSAWLAAAPKAAPGGLLERPALLWLLAGIGLACAFSPEGFVAALGLHFPDTDDAMRLAEVRDLVNGQPWFDLVQHRFLPPVGVQSHWSRLLDAPLAAAIAGLTPWVGPRLAEGLTVALWPPLLFALYLAILYRGTARLLSRRAAILAVFAASLTLGLVLQFRPGRIDHHNVQILCLIGVGLCLMDPARRAAPAALAGFLCALSLAIGLEAVPLIAVAGLFVLGAWVLTGRTALPRFLGFGLALGLGAGGLFALQTDPALWAVGACDALSPPWLWLAGSAGLLALSAALLPERAPPVARLGLLAAGGAVSLAGFAWLFPHCLGGPFPGMPEVVRAHWLRKIFEMRPLPAILHDAPAEGFGYAFVLLPAALVSALFALRGPCPRRVFLLSALFLATGAAQSGFQFRGFFVAIAFVPLVAGAALDRAFALIGDTTRPPVHRLGPVAAALCLLSPVWLLPVSLAKALTPSAPTETPAQTGSCTAPEAFRTLAGLPPGLVLAPIDLGPAILLNTPHSIVAAPYHRASAGLQASLEAFGADEDAMRRQVEALGVRYVALCAATPPASLDDRTPFATRLARGQTAVAWLEPVGASGGPLRLWRVP